MFSNSATISGTQIKWLLRPKRLTCTQLTEGPSWHGTGPQLGSLIWPKILCFSIQCTWSNGKAVVQLVSAFIAVLRTATTWHKGMWRNFRTEYALLDKIETPGHRKKQVHLRVQKHYFTPLNTNFLVKQFIPMFIKFLFPPNQGCYAVSKTYENTNINNVNPLFLSCLCTAQT